MFPIMFAAIIGGFATAGMVTSSHGLLIGALSLPFAGSLWACVPIVLIAWANRNFDVDQRLTDEMVADLRSMAEAGRRYEVQPARARARDAA